MDKTRSNKRSSGCNLQLELQGFEFDLVPKNDEPRLHLSYGVTMMNTLIRFQVGQDYLGNLEVKPDTHLFCLFVCLFD